MGVNVWHLTATSLKWHLPKWPKKNKINNGRYIREGNQLFSRPTWKDMSLALSAVITYFMRGLFIFAFVSRGIGYRRHCSRSAACQALDWVIPGSDKSFIFHHVKSCRDILWQNGRKCFVLYKLKHFVQKSAFYLWVTSIIWII